MVVDRTAGTQGADGVAESILSAQAAGQGTLTKIVVDWPREAGHDDVEPLIADLVASFERLDAADITIHGAAISQNEATFEHLEASLKLIARYLVDIAGRLIVVAKRADMPEDTYSALAEQANDWSLALDWTHEDYAKSEVFQRITADAMDDYEAGAVEEGGFGP